jgi:hypothetical protein
VKTSFPASSMFRSLVLSEPDELPYDEGVTKLETFSKILDKELLAKA